MRRAILGFLLGVAVTVAVFSSLPVLLSAVDELMTDVKGAGGDDGAGPPPSAERFVADRLGTRGRGMGGGGTAEAFGSGADRRPGAPSAAGAPSANDEAPAAPSARSWFPETFLWTPALVVGTDPATLSVPAPDTLTTWRVLALGASRGGQQAGATAELVTRLPVGIEALLPPRLRAGDRVVVQARLTSTVDDAVPGRLTAQGAGVGAVGGGQVTLPPRGVVARPVTVTATTPGAATLEVGFAVPSGPAAPGDAWRGHTTVVPRGRPEPTSRRGVLGDASPFTLEVPADAEHASLQVTVVPGPLALLRHELTHPWFAEEQAIEQVQAWSLALGQRAAPVLAALGTPPDAATLEQLRGLRLRAIPKLLEEARTPPGALRVLEAVGPLDDPDSPLASLVALARTTVAPALRPDGTWATADGSVQRLIVASARAAEVVADPLARARTASFIHRNAAWLGAEATADPFTAATVLAAGLADEELAADLAAQVRAAVVTEDGLPALELRPGTYAADGAEPGPVEALAVAARALGGDEGLRLLAAALATYDPTVGFADAGEALAVLAALEALQVPVAADPVAVVLEIDGAPAARATVRPQADVALVTLATPLTPGDHTVRIVPDGAPAGMSWSLTLTSYRPWGERTGRAGLEVSVNAPQAPAVGRPATVTFHLAGPAGLRVELAWHPPAGVIVLPTEAATELSDERVVVPLSLDAAGGGTVSLQVLPTLAGAVWSGPAVLEAHYGAPAWSPPQAWTIR